MRMRGRARLLGIFGLAAAVLGLIMLRPPWLSARVAAWRFPEQIAIAEQFLLAAERSDSVGLTDLASGPEPVTQWLNLVRGKPAVAAALPVRELAGATTRNDASAGVHIGYRLPTPELESLCSGFGGSDGLQLTVIPDRDTWKVSRAALSPC